MITSDKVRAEGARGRDMLPWLLQQTRQAVGGVTGTWSERDAPDEITFRLLPSGEYEVHWTRHLKRSTREGTFVVEDPWKQRQRRVDPTTDTSPADSR
jgi:hypothetical protein